VPRVLLLVPVTSYRTEAFLDAARRLRLDVTVGSNHRQLLAKFAPGRTLYINLRDNTSTLAAIVRHCRDYPVAAVIGTDDETTTLAAQAAAALEVQHNAISAVSAARNKLQFRRLMSNAQLNGPGFNRIELSAHATTVSATMKYPCVLKPLDLSGSRGVIRANNKTEFVRAFHRVRSIVETCAEPDSDPALLVEDFIEGIEVSLEGLVTDGALSVLALFDKPNPLDGPFFEETIYVTPSRLGATQQRKIVAQTEAAVRALGLTTGPIHAELRLGPKGAFVIEIAPRTIGGLCSRALRFQANASLEEIVLRQAVGAKLDAETNHAPSGVMMIPIPGAGILKTVRGLSAATAVAGITDINIAIPPGEMLIPLPEGGRYLGFIFAEADSAEAVEHALRTAHGKLHFDISSPHIER